MGSITIDVTARIRLRLRRYLMVVAVTVWGVSRKWIRGILLLLLLLLMLVMKRFTIAVMIGVVKLMEIRMIRSFFHVRWCCIHGMIMTSSNWTVLMISSTAVISPNHLIQIVRAESHRDGDLKVIRCKQCQWDLPGFHLSVATTACMLSGTWVAVVHGQKCDGMRWVWIEQRH